MLKRVANLSRMLVERKRLVVGWALGVPFVWLAVSLLIGPQYAASSSFMPKSSQANGAEKFAGLAGQCGLQPNLGDQVGYPVRFHAEPLKARRVWVEAARARANRTRDGVNGTNTVTASMLELQRQTRAGSERRFVEARLSKARAEFRDAEDALQEFSVRNRRYDASPDLRVQYGRLERAVSLRQQGYTQLAAVRSRALWPPRPANRSA